MSFWKHPCLWRSCKKPQRIAGSKPFVSECARCFLEPPPLAFPAGLLRDITQSIVRVIGSVTLCGTFTSGRTAHLWRRHALFLAMDKVAVQMFAAPIERTPKNIVSLAILVSLATRKRRRGERKYVEHLGLAAAVWSKQDCHWARRRYAPSALGVSSRSFPALGTPRCAWRGLRPPRVRRIVRSNF